MPANHPKARALIRKAELFDQNYNSYVVYSCVTIERYSGVYFDILTVDLTDPTRFSLNIYCNFQTISKNIELLLWRIVD